MAEERKENPKESNMEIDGGSSFAADDVMIEILLLLPAKSLGRFKCVCKKWYNLIQNPNFIKNHFNRSNNHNRLFAPIHSQSTWSHDDISFTLFLDESLSVRQNIDNPLISDVGLYTDIRMILGPVNGLYFIQYDYFGTDYEDSIALWNPTTSEFRQLNFPSIELPTHITSPTSKHHFGFGSTDDDIKLVCISSFIGYIEDYSFVVSLYSLAHDCWRQIEFDTNVVPKSIHLSRASAYLNGAYYWLVRNNYHYHVIVFDMRTEVIREVPLPAETLLYNGNNSLKYSFFDQILVRNSSIVLFVTQSFWDERFFTQVIDCVDIWEMKEEGCWNKLFCFAPSFSFIAPLGFWKDDEILFRANGTKLFLYNIRSNETRNLGIETRFSVLDYKESLTSVKGGRWIDSTPLEL